MNHSNLERGITPKLSEENGDDSQEMRKGEEAALLSAY